MAGMIPHAGEPLNHARDSGEGPQLGRESVRAGTFAERLIDARQLRRRQFRLATGAARPAQGAAAASSPGVIPAAHTLPAHPQRARNLGHDRAGGKQTRRLPAALLQALEVSALSDMSGVHAPIINEGAGNVTLFCEIH